MVRGVHPTRARERQREIPANTEVIPDAVNVNNMPVTQTVSGTVTVSTMPNPTTVSIGHGNPGTSTGSDAVFVYNTVSITGTVSANLANPVTVSGTVTANPTTSAAFVTNQVSITASATQIFAVNTSTIFREIANSTTTTIYIGGSLVTTTTGHIITGPSYFDQTYNSAVLYGIVATGSVTVSTIGW